MMLRTLLATGMLASSIVLPLTAHAYVSPEEVLDDGNYDTDFYTPPPSKRQVQQRVQEQQERSAAQREADFNAANPPAEEPEEEIHEAAPEEDPGESELDALIKAIQELQEGEDGSEDLSADELRDERILERIRQQQLRDDRAAYQAMMTGQETMHGGAPLADTGPAAVLTAIAVAGAIGETWRRVRNSEKNL